MARARAAAKRGESESGALEARSLPEAEVAGVLAEVVRVTAQTFAPRQDHLDGRLFRLAQQAKSLPEDLGLSRASQLGELYERLISEPVRHASGSFFTPTPLARRVAKAALRIARDTGVAMARVCDPACGGGAFLLAAAEELYAQVRERSEVVPGDLLSLRRRIAGHLYGVDLSELAVAVTEAALWLWVSDPRLPMSLLGRQLAVGDAVEGDALESLAKLGHGGFDCVLGNPPWVSYAGRAAKPLEPERRRYLAGRYSAFAGYPSLHGVFVERACELVPHGVVSLVLPSPVADLKGYAATRRALTRRHELVEPLLEFGQDAFAEVTQPCFALIATASAGARASDEPWLLQERSRSREEARQLKVPFALERLAAFPKLPPGIFGEVGFQSTRRATEKLLVKNPVRPEPGWCPLLEGKDVIEFQQRPVRVFLAADAEQLAWAGCKLRSREAYERVKFVVRQTAKVPIAARHSGLAFRNSLLGGFEAPGLSAPTLVGLLNSTLYRALHLASHRDARQAVFPQVKIRHLRALPCPPDEPEALGAIARLSIQAEQVGGWGVREELDRAVFELFSCSGEEQLAINDFLRQWAPEALSPPKQR